MTFDNNGRMYVWERRGQVWIVENGIKSAQPLIDIREEVGNWRDFGMLGVALDPDFLSNGYIYLLYIVDRHHLLYFGTPNYNPNTDEYFNATIGRITRYRAEASTNFTTVDYSSRKILLGESITTGFPNLHESHGTGHLVFGTDGTLLASFGDGASYSSRDEGSAGETYWQQAIADGIIPASHNVGAYRSQILNSLAGKIVRLDPETGDGIYNNPYYDAANPRSPQSRVWGRGLRNPCRFSLKPGTGSHDVDDADPGTFYIGDVGWANREEMSVCDGPAMNFGWPRFEGMTYQPGYNNNTYAPSSHDRPKLDWRNGSARGVVNGNIVNIGSGQLPGPSFTGNCSIGGVWYTGTDFPSEYQNTYFHADYGGDWIRNFGFNGQDEPTISRSFKQGVDRPIYIATDPNQGGLYYLTVGGNNYVRQFTYSPGNLAPKAVASSNLQSGSSPLTVQFIGSDSYDPDQNNLTYSWDFGDGNSSNQANPIHTYTQGNGNPGQYNVKLTVSDGNLSDEAFLAISINNTPPEILSTSLDNLSIFSPTNPTTLNLSATVNDAESSNSQLSFSWVTSLYHNDHSHDEPPITSPTGSAVLSPIGCDGTTYWYRVWLTVTDPQGLSTTIYKDLYPNCGGNNQTLTFNPISDKLTTDPSFTLNPSASSGLPVTLFLVSGPASISGNTVTLTGQPGEVVIRAAQGGNGTYKPAVAIDRSFQVRQPGPSNQAPNAAFLASPLTGPAPLQVSVNASGSNDPNGDPLTYAWDFGNGETASGQNASVTYADPGSYTITLYVNDGQLGDQVSRTIEVLTPGGCTSPQNLALGQAASQSSTYGVGLAGLAVDGNTSGSSPWSADLQHTQNQSQPWWQVDLGQLSQIDALTIYNRTDALQERLKDFYILISNSPMSGNTPLSTLLADGSITQIFYPGTAGASVSFTPDVEGRYVRVQLSGNGVLHMAEVEVTGCPSGNDPCNGAQPVVINPAGPFVENAGIQSLSATPTGGTWGGAAASNGTFDPSIGPGTYTVTYTYTNGNGCTQSDVEDIMVNPVGGCTTLSNLALGKPSSQSSTYGVGEARYANDGNPSGSSPWTADLQHTQSEANPWWEVNLGSVQQIDQIDIYNRSNGNQNRLNNFYILVSATPMTGAASLSELLNNPSIQQIHFPGIAGAQESFVTNIQGQYIRVQLGGNGILHMAEVEVKGCSQGTDPCASNGVSNLALNRPTDQSSVYGFGIPTIAVDGDTDGTRGPWGNASIIHTQREAQPWWQVTLLNPSDISEVIIHNRTDCCQIRLKDFYVLVSDQPFPNGASLNSLVNDPNVSNTYFPGTAGNLEQISVDGSGRYVRIQLTSGNEILHVAEVEVMGCPQGNQSTRFSSLELLEESVYELSMQIHPNPTKDHFQVVIPHLGIGEAVEFELYDLTGRQLWRKQGLSGESFDSSALPSGVYLLKARTAKWKETQRLMIR